MTPDDARIIGIGAPVIGQPQPEQPAAEPLIDPDSFTAGSLAGTCIGVLCGAVLGYALTEAALHAHRFYQDLRAPSATAPAAIPCAGPGLNEHTYIVLANLDGQIRLHSCTTVHVLGR